MLTPERRDRYTISASALRAFDCRLKWFWSYCQGYQRVVPKTSLALGRLVHEALDVWYAEQTDPVALFRERAEEELEGIDAQWADEKEELAEAFELGEAMLAGYLEEYPDDHAQWDILATEHRLEKRIPTPNGGLSQCWLVARLDGLIRDERGRVWVLEHKTYSRKPSGDYLAMDQQMTIQTWLGQDLAGTLGIDDEVVGVIWNGLRKQAPSKRVRNPLFMREYLFRSQPQIEWALTRAYQVYREMRNPEVIYPEPDMIRCTMCDFQQSCQELQRDGDWEFLMDTQYTSREEREAEEDELDDE